MEIGLSILLFIVGILLVIKGGDLFVDAATWIAMALRVPTFIIGATIVSIATTMPEMLVSAFAAAEGKTDMAIGNAVGSVTANTGLIMAVAMLAMSIVCKRKQYMTQCLMLLGTAVVLTVSCMGGELNIVGSLILLLIFLAFMALNIRNAKKQKNDMEKLEPISKKALGIKLLMFVVAAIAIIWGSQLMVDNGSEIAAYLGVSERIIALTLVAIGTSLPELVTTIAAIVKKEASLSVGNIIGANIIDLTLILPICSIVSGKALPVAQQSMRMDIPVCLGVIALAMVPMIVREKTSKVQGLVMIGAYIAYLIAVI